MRRIVVVGNGIAGQTACDSLRSAGFDGELTVIGAESHRPYSRPALSKALLHDADGIGSHALPEPDHGANEILGIGATGLDVETGRVLLEQGESVPYDGLVIASGSRARRLSGGQGSGSAGRELTLRTLEDAIALRQAIAARPSVVVVGGGPLGVEVASGAVQAGCAVTLVSEAPPLTRQLGGHLAGIFTEAAVLRGLRIVRAGKAQLSESGTRVVLEDGTEVEGDLLVTAIGDEPNVHWLAGTNLLRHGTLRVDSRGRLAPGIVAAGDVAFFPTDRGVMRVPLWTSAIDQAKVAARGLIQGEAAAEFDFQPYFWTEAFGLSLKSVGFTPVPGLPDHLEQGKDPDSQLMYWEHADGSGTAASINYRIPVPKLRRLANTGPAALRPAVSAV
jgi:3-phenylpropionate/trans-cinnamate dioxygenase ferredoxin reductase subunit